MNIFIIFFKGTHTVLGVPGQIFLDETLTFLGTDERCLIHIFPEDILSLEALTFMKGSLESKSH